MLIGECFESFLTFAESYGGSCWFSVWIVHYISKEANIPYYIFRNLICTSVTLMYMEPYFENNNNNKNPSGVIPAKLQNLYLI